MKAAYRPLALAVLAAPFAAALVPANAVSTPVGDEKPAAKGVWDARMVEHLYKRAGFGASSAQISRG